MIKTAIVTETKSL